MVIGVVKQLAKKHGITKHVGKIRDGVSKINNTITTAEMVGNQIAATPGVGRHLEKFYLDKMGGRQAYDKVKQGQRVMNKGARVMNQVDRDYLR